jgi:hypothetical protein
MRLINKDFTKLDNIDFDKIKDINAIYIISNKNEFKPIYIGIASNLKLRLKESLAGILSENLNNVSLYYWEFNESSRNEAENLEKELISNYLPSFNKRFNNEITRRAFKFEEFCEKLFKKSGFKIVNPDSFNKHMSQVDLIVEKDNKQAVIEIKFYKTTKANYSLLKKAISQVKMYGEYYKISNQILIIATTIDEELKHKLESDYKVIILDSKNLLYLLKDDDKLLIEYKNLLSDTSINIYNSNDYIPTDLNNILIDKEYNKNLMSTFQFEFKQDNWLCSELNDIPSGKASFRDYEKKCTEILKYLFPTILTGWNEQLRTDDGLNRYDLVCRAKKGNEFWDLLINEFNSRYIIFEFKNYADEIKQTQVYTTEKYLYQTALRNVAFIISKKGASTNAMQATKGILRENGKLIINLTNEDLCEMIKMKNEGSEPSDYLFEFLDIFLLELGK